MKPLRLALQAFGSYAGELTVDFARLARHGVFAISGPTGAGKSTIFDALVYALYDDLPGFRVDGNVRSQYAADTVETRVRLEFEVRGERWAVERKPTQHLRRRRGQGAPIERKSTVLLERLAADGSPLEGSGTSRKAAVTQQIDSLVGLSKAQFEQVMLIPQGRFEEVLKADTKARAVLLRRLFPVEVYGRVTAALKIMADDRQRAFADASRARGELVERLRAALVAALEAAGSPIDEGLADPGELDVDHLAHHLTTLSSARMALERAVNGARAEYDRAVRLVEDARVAAGAWDGWQADKTLAASFSAEEEADAVEAERLERARRLTDLNGALEAWSQASDTLAQGEPERAGLQRRVTAACRDLDYEVAETTLTGAGTAGRLAERLRFEAIGLRDELARFDALVDDGRSLEHRGAALAEKRKAIDRQSSALASDRQALEELADEVENLARAAAGLEAAAAVAEVLAAERTGCLRRAAALQELESAALARETAAAAANASQGRLEDVRTAWRNGLAGQLAALLVEGDPCPTCGALEHPDPAPRPDDAPDDEALAAAESARDEALRLLRRAEARYAGAKGAVEALRDTRPLSQVDAELDARQAERARCRDAAERLKDVREQLTQRRSSLAAGCSAVEAGARQLQVDEATLDAARSAHKQARAEYEQRHGGFVSPARRAEAMAALAEDADRLARLLSDLERAHSTERQFRALLAPLLDELGLDDPVALEAFRCDPGELGERATALVARAEARAEVRRRIADYEAAGVPSVRPDVAALAASAESARSRHLELVGRHAVMEDNASYVAAGPALLETATKEVVAARRALEQARTMADRCAGAGGGSSPTRLSLENWVLADYLRHVLAQANVRLATMTAGRFALQLSDGVTDGRKAWGLELSAFDAYTGQVRPATTLSGGETFMAALALALGLADVVSGGSNREMGALFVDEGFGSLDPQALESVVDVLRSLEDGGRLVGVVSHVEAVQQALPIGIAVRATPCGSEAEVRYPPE